MDDEKRLTDQPVPSVPEYGYAGFTPANGHAASPIRKHSGVGIASFILFCVMTAFFIVLLVAMTMQATGIAGLEGKPMDPEDLAKRIEGAPEFIIMSLLLFSTVIGNIIGLILGIVGLVQKERKKLFAILGTVLNGLVVGFLLLVVIIIIALGTAV